MELERIRARYGEKIEAFRAAAHRCPELGKEEHETTALIRRQMLALGTEELETGLPTGAAFRFRGSGAGRTVVLRADIDGLPVEEPENSPIRSAYPGRMHACGHDVHMASLYGAAMLLKERGELPGDVVFLFQPAEETTGGAASVIASGLLECVGANCVIGLHNMPSMPVGVVGVREGALMSAKDSFRITIHGRGGSGAAPEKCADPIVASAAVIVGIQTIVSRNVSPLDMAVVSVCSIHGGRTDNRIEDGVTLDGSFRTFRRETRTLIMERLRRIAADCAQGYDCTATVVFSDETPAVVNDASLLGAATRAANAVGCVVRPELAMISEDFSAYCERVPSFFFFLGSGENENSAPLHSANYRAHPDAALYGAALLACAAIEAGADGTKNEA